MLCYYLQRDILTTLGLSNLGESNTKYFLVLLEMDSVQLS